MKKTLTVLALLSILSFGLFGQTKNSPVAGDWISRGDNQTIELDFDRDGEATIEIYNRGTKFEWEGTWTVSNNEIIFNVKKVEFENKSFGQKEERKTRVNQIFRIKYSIVNGTLTITCPDLPEEITSASFVKNRD